MSRYGKMLRAPGKAPAKKRAAPRKLEEAEQCALVEWIDTWTARCPLLENFTAMPNGGMRPQRVDPKTGRRFSVEAMKMIRMGARKGYPDVLLDVVTPAAPGLRIEMKVRALGYTGTVSDEQLAWHHRLRVQGYDVRICWSWREAARALVDYLTPVLPQRLAVAMRASIPGA